MASPLRTAMYVVFLGLLTAGLWAVLAWACRQPTSPPALVVAAPASSAPGAVPPQVEAVGLPTTVARPERVVEARSARTPEQAAAADRRADALKRTLANIQGEPVYVEGIDGPAPKPKSAKAPSRPR